MTQRNLQKWHGAGNDFLVEVTSAATDIFWSAPRVASLCDRHRGVGADGLMIAQLGDGVVTMTLFNADGSRAEMSGNGIRCLAAAVRRTTNDSSEVLTIHTDAGTRRVTLELDGETGYGTVSMGAVTLQRALERSAGVASVGNPHVVVMDDNEWSDHDRERLAAELAPQLGGANVEFVSVQSRERVSIKVIERGVGWTLACGTGSVATAAVLHAQDIVDDRVIVANPGGELTVQLNGNEATLGGPVEFIADVAWTAS